MYFTYTITDFFCYRKTKYYYLAVDSQYGYKTRSYSLGAVQVSTLVDLLAFEILKFYGCVIHSKRFSAF